MRISETWRESTPESLQSAVEHIRSRFDDRLYLAKSTDRECHEALTVSTRSSPEPVIFQTYFNSLAKSICDLVGQAFALLLQLALKNQIEKPIKWARTQVTLMLEDELLLSEAMRIRTWIVIACDGRDHPQPAPEHGPAAEEAWLFHRDWQSPGWLSMKPLGNFTYHSLIAWERDNIERSQGVLEYHSNICSLRIESCLKNLAGRAEVELALKGSDERAPEPISGSSSAPIYEFWRDRTTGTWTIRMTSLSPDAVPIADHTSVNLDYLWAALKAGSGGAQLSEIANEAGIRRRSATGVSSGGAVQTTEAGLSSETLGSRVLDGRALSAARDEMERLESEARKAEQDGHPDIAFERRQKADDINSHITKQTRPFRGVRRHKTDSDRTANTVQQGIKRALGAISKGNQKVGRFLRANLKFESGRCWTICDTGEWRFHE
jgi:hypothetical protein